jgi:hypothetical protein
MEEASSLKKQGHPKALHFSSLLLVQDGYNAPMNTTLAQARAIECIRKLMENESLLLISRPIKIDVDEFVVYYTWLSEDKRQVTLMCFNTSNGHSEQVTSVLSKAPFKTAARLMSTITQG